MAPGSTPSSTSAPLLAGLARRRCVRVQRCCLAEVLQKQNVPRYFNPQNNLLSDVTEEWCQFYSEMFTFSDESALIESLLHLQRKWRIEHFPLCIETYWSKWLGEEITLDTIMKMLMNINNDAMINLHPVRAVQAFWNYHQIFHSLLTSSKRGDNLENEEEKFNSEFFRDLKSLLTEKLISEDKYSLLLHLLKLMAPDGYSDKILESMMKEQNIEKKDPTILYDSVVPYGSMTLKKLGLHHIDDCSFEFKVTNVCAILDTEEGPITYTFPYTDHSVLFSSHFYWFRYAQQLSKKYEPGEIKNQIDNLPGNIPMEWKTHIMVKLICLLRELYLKNWSFPNLDSFKSH